MFKFRQWDKELKTFLYYELVNGCVIISNPEINSLDRIRADSPQELLITRDKDDTPIYVGDLIQGDWTYNDYNTDGILLVEQNEPGMVEPFYEEYGNSGDCLYVNHIVPANFKVVGNIHENPEIVYGKRDDDVR